MNYDIIGDIHGHASALRTLLAKLGYQESQNTYRHPDRTAIFVGDFIDRGPQQVETVNLVRRMVDAGNALAVMGNHEFNAIAWHTPDPNNPGDYLRPHHSAKYGEKNFKQHQAFLAEVDGTPRHDEIIGWFKTLPLWIDLPGLRVVHGCWHPKFIDYLTPQLAEGNRLPDALLPSATLEPEDEREKDTPEPTVFKAIEALTKGIEIPLPAGKSFQDKDGITRHRVRSRWWDLNASTYPLAAMLDEPTCQTLPNDSIPEHARIGDESGKPTFIGHYWLSGIPTRLSPTTACVDYSIAKGGRLVAYRWNGEPELHNSNFCWVGA